MLFHLFTLLEIPLEVRQHIAVGTSLSTIIVTSIASVRAHHKKGAVDWALFRAWLPAVAVGVAIGTVVAGLVDGRTLTGVIAVMAMVVAQHIALAPESLRLGTRLPGRAAQAGIGSVIGGISAMMGIGGGTLTVPTLVLFDYPVKRAVATAAAIGLLIAVPGTIGFVLSGLGQAGLPPFSVGYVNLIGFALLFPVTTLTAPWGAKLAHAIRPRLLKLAFALFLAATSVRMAWVLIG